MGSCWQPHGCNNEHLPTIHGFLSATSKYDSRSLNCYCDLFIYSFNQPMVVICLSYFSNLTKPKVRLANFFFYIDSALQSHPCLANHISLAASLWCYIVVFLCFSHHLIMLSLVFLNISVILEDKQNNCEDVL